MRQKEILCLICRKREFRGPLSKFCWSCKCIAFDIQLYCVNKTASARRHGILPALKGLNCVDCGEAATCYDHRDYGKPLAVHPVCRSCNAKRGPGHYPSKLFKEFKLRRTMIRIKPDKGCAA